MEITESILGRKVVALDDRKAVGCLKGIIVDCAQYRISHYIVQSEDDTTLVALPFNKVIAVGDTYMTIQDAAVLVPQAEMFSPYAVTEDFDLLGIKVYSRAGNFLGTIKTYDLESETGSLARVVLEEGSVFTQGQYVSLSPEFLFVDDGTPTDADVRSGAAKRIPLTPVDGHAAGGTADEHAAGGTVEGHAAGAPVDESETTPVGEQKAAEAEEDPDEVLRAYLFGRKVSERVESADATFVLENGEEITADVLDAAQQADALLLLTMALADEE